MTSIRPDSSTIGPVKTMAPSEPRQPKEPNVLELRVHGVSGTPAKVMLESDAVLRVDPRAGAGAGFYRRLIPQTDKIDDTLEAYSWGGLTSGNGSRALWLLLLPFALVNVASWTAPGDPASSSAARRLSESTLRLLAFTLTCTLVTAAASIAVDLIAWQCATTAACAEQNPIPKALAAGFGTTGQRIAVAALVPALLICVLWFLGSRTWAKYEMVRPPTDAGDGIATSERADSLADQRFWCGDAPVQRLREVHVSGAWALLAVLVSWPALRGSLLAADAPPGPRIIVLLGLAVLVVCSVVVCLPSIADRLAPRSDSASAERDRRRLAWFVALRWAALALAVAAIASSYLGDDLTTRAATATGGMPGMSAALEVLFAVQAVAIVVLFLTALLLRQEAASTPSSPPAAHGFALPMLAAAAWLVAGGLSAAVALQVEWRLTSGAAAAPAPYHFAAFAAVVLAAAVVVVVVAAAVQVARAASAEAASVSADYANDIGSSTEDTARHLKKIAQARAFAGITDSAPTYLLSLVLVTVVAVALVATRYVMTPVDVRAEFVQEGTRSALASFASTLMIGVAIAFFVVALLAYRFDGLRRSVGVIWDLASFWPRAVHPLAPPSYGEKAVPDLIARLRHEAADRVVVLSTHSQGSVLAIATILQLPPATAPNVCLLTYGSPLTRLYSKFFPGYFNVEAFTASMHRLGALVDDHAVWPWINLYRLTDPIGGWIFGAPANAAVTPPADVDVRLLDPALRARGDSSWPKINRHSGYFPAEDYTLAKTAVVMLRRPVSPAEPAPTTAPDGGPR